MKVEFKDEHALQLSSALTGAVGIASFGWPEKTQDFFQGEGKPSNKTNNRWLGLSMLSTTAATFVGSRAGSTTQKEMLKAASVCWGASAANSAWNAHKEHEKKEVAWTNAAVQAGMMGLMLWRGLAKDGK